MYSNEAPKISRGQIKKYLTITTIALVTVCAFLAIIAIFVGSNLTLLKLLSTLLIMYLVLVYSTNNITRLSDRLPIVRVLSILALISNFFWSVLWILLVWDAFGSFDVYTRDTIWKIVGSAAVISAFCTILAARIKHVINWPTIIMVYKSLSLVCVGFLGLDLLLTIWIPSMDGELLIKLILAECILVCLQWIVAKLLINNASQLGINVSTGSNHESTPPQTSKPVTVVEDGQPVDTEANMQAQQPAAPTNDKTTSFLKAIGIIALVWIALSLIIPIICGLIGLLLYTTN